MAAKANSAHRARLEPSKDQCGGPEPPGQYGRCHPHQGVLQVPIRAVLLAVGTPRINHTWRPVSGVRPDRVPGRGKDAPPTCPLGERGQEGRKDARPSPRDTQAPHPRPGPAQPSPDLLTAPPGGRSWVGAGASPRRKGPLGRGSQESHSSLVSLETLLQVLALLLLRVILCPLQTVLCVSAKRKTKGKDRAQGFPGCSGSFPTASA